MKTDELTELYSKTLFTSSDESVVFNESDKSATVTKVEVSYAGAHFDYCTENIWKAGVDLYNKGNGDISLRRKCDGFIICKTDEKKYLIWLEIKSGFSEVFKNAIEQLAVCYIKMKSYLRNISTYNADDFEEVAVVVSHPEEHNSNTIEENNIVLGRKISITSHEESMSEKCRRRYRKTGNIIIKAEDLASVTPHLTPDILPHNLRVIHFTTTTDTATIDLKSLLI